MPVSGIVLALTPEESLRRRALSSLEADPRVTLGDASNQGAFQPIVTVTETMTEHMDLWDELDALEGVLQTRLAFHDFSDVEDPSGESGLPRRRRPWSRGG